MFDFGNFGQGLIGLIIGIINLYIWIVIIRALISWVNPDPYNPIVRFLHAVTDPVLNAIRRKMPNFMWATSLDFSPLVLIMLLLVAKLFLDSIRFG